MSSRDGTTIPLAMSDSPDSQINDPIFDKQWEDSEERSTAVTSNTPDSELSPPDSPIAKSAGIDKIDGRAKSRSLAASLSLEEQV
jgi:beta-glucosidase